MLNRRYALLGWAVWKVGKIAAKRRAKAMVPSVSSERRSRGLVVAVPLLALAAAASWLLFFRRRGAEAEHQPEPVAEPVG